MNTTKKQNKYIYGYKLFVNYGNGYEFETWENTLKEAKAQAKCYRENCPQYSVKIGKGRELNPEYIEEAKTNCISIPQRNYRITE